VRVLVTGGNRYIGLDLVFELARRGHEVTVINSHQAPLPGGTKRIHADRRQPGALEAALRDHRDAFDVVFDHTAYTPDDIIPMVELFRDRVAHYVFTSSQAVYRRSYVQPIREDFRRHAPDDSDPRKAYGVGKVQCEDYDVRVSPPPACVWATPWVRAARSRPATPPFSLASRPAGPS
jgi:nucleoside-diphosphate-sugar epimerase